MIKSILCTLTSSRLKGQFFIFQTLFNKILITNSFRAMENKEDTKVKEDKKENDIDHGSSTSSSNDNFTEDGLYSKMENICKFFQQRLLVSNNNQESQKNILKEATVDGIVDFIKTHNVTKIITMAGAGISTSAGIPDFRSPKSGLYHNLEKYKLPHPQAIFELNFFKQNPEPFFTLAKQLLPEGYKPTPSHYFIRLLHEKGLLLRHYSQNIDALERMALLPEDKIVEAHGTFHTGQCLDCHSSYDLNWMKDQIKKSTIPKCEECTKGIVKPDIVFFGEMLPDIFHTSIEKDFPQAELLIIMGSSLIVQPFASLVDRVHKNCPRLLINKEKVGTADRLNRFLGLQSGLNFDAKNTRDVAFLGDCDTNCQLLADKLGWGDELKDLIMKDYQRLESESEQLKDLVAKENRRCQNEKASNL